MSSEVKKRRRTLEACEHCSKKFEELVTREYFCMSYAVEWVCASCFEDLEGVSFDDYKIEEND